MAVAVVLPFATHLMVFELLWEGHIVDERIHCVPKHAIERLAVFTFFLALVIALEARQADNFAHRLTSNSAPS